MKTNLSSLRLVLWLFALFLVILGAKLCVIQLYGSWLPAWDQWDEANRFFRHWLEGHLTWRDWFEPHNEHRIFLTRLLDFSVISLNGRWDTLLQMTINAVLHAGYACVLAYCLWIIMGRKNPGLICLLLAPFFALPFAAENVIRGFDSQQYFLLMGALVTVFGLGFTPLGSRWWWLGLLAAILSLFTMASGLLASLAVAGLMGLRVLKEKKPTRAGGITLLVCLAVFALGLALSVSAPGDRLTQAKSLTDFTTTLARNLAWPFLDQPAMIVVVCLPLVVLLVLYFRPDFSECRAAEFLLGFGFWGLLQSAALAYGRANYVDAQGSRYLDTLCIVAMASVFGAVLLSKQFTPVHFPLWTTRLLPLGFAALVFFGTWQLSRQTVDFFLASVKVDDLIEEESVRAFAATNDARWLQDKLVPLPNPAVTLAVLRDQKLSPIMPLPCRAPDESINEPGGWLSILARTLREHATYVLLTGLGLFICLSVVEAIGRQDNSPEHRFASMACLLAGLLALVWVWPNRNLDSVGRDRDLHRILGFHFMARGDYKQAALQFTSVLRLEIEGREIRNAQPKTPDHLQTLTLAEQCIARVAASKDSNLAGFLNKNLKGAAEANSAQTVPGGQRLWPTSVRK